MALPMMRPTNRKYSRWYSLMADDFAEGSACGQYSRRMEGGSKQGKLTLFG